VVNIDHVLRRSKQNEFMLFNIDQVLRCSKLNSLKSTFHSRFILFAAAKKLYAFRSIAYLGLRSLSGWSCSTTFNNALWTLIRPLYSMNPSRRNLFMKKLTRERVVPIIFANVC
jgi:hypothetical protein